MHSSLYTRRHFLSCSLGIAGASTLGILGSGIRSAYGQGNPAAWSATLKQARGQTVRFNAWGGDEKINAYIRWAGSRAYSSAGVNVQHVKLADTVEAVRTVLAEKSARNNDKGTIDLIWINGENFYNMKRNNLLYGPFAEDLPAFQYVDTENKPTVQYDFSIPTDGFEAPWGMANFTMIADTRRVTELPRNPAEILAYSKANPGRFTYPLPPDYIGSAFLKQLLLTLNNIGQKGVGHPDYEAIYAEVTASDFERLGGAVWKWIDALHPHAWQKGKRFPSNYAMLRDQLNNAAIDFAMAYNPNEAATAIIQDQLPSSVRPFTFEGGMIGNTHFVAIPFNSPNSAAAQVFSNLLMSGEAQAHKADLAVWGDPTVLAIHKLPDVDKSRFVTSRHPAQLTLTANDTILREPHPTWQERLEQAWIKKYGVS